MRKKWIVFILIGILLPLSSAVSSSANHSNFEVNSAFVKLSMKGNESVVRRVEIKSHGSYDFKVRIEGTNAVSVDEKEFKMKAGEEKTININFDSHGKAPGVYFGKLVISGGDTVSIPVIMDVESSDVLFDGTLSVPIEDVNVYSGENMVVNNKIFNLDNIGAKKVQITYLLKGFDGKTIFSDEQNIVVQDHISNTEVVSIPADTIPGDYLFIAIMKYKNSVGTTSYFFKINKKSVAKSSLKSFAWIVIILLIFLVFFIIYYTLRRDSVLLGLQEQYRREMQEREADLKKEKLRLNDLGKKEKAVSLKKIKREYKKKKKAVKKIYKHRVKIIKILKKEKKVSEMDAKLKEWKKAGYNLAELDAVENNHRKSPVTEYRKEGYNL